MTESHFKFSFKIEQKPDGSFIARSDDPPHTLEGATREEIENQIRGKIAATLGPGIAGKLPLGKPGIHLEKKFSVRLEKRQPSSSSSDQLAAGTPEAPLQPDTLFSFSTLLKAFTVIAIILLLWRIFGRH